MFSSNAMAFLKCLSDIYKDTGVNSFAYHQYMSIPNHEAAIEELMDAGYLSWQDGKKNILGTVVINFDSLENDR